MLYLLKSFNFILNLVFIAEYPNDSGYYGSGDCYDDEDCVIEGSGSGDREDAEGYDEDGSGEGGEEDPKGEPTPHWPPWVTDKTPKLEKENEIDDQGIELDPDLEKPRRISSSASSLIYSIVLKYTLPVLICYLGGFI